MPLILHHGPASAKKQQALKKLLTSRSIGPALSESARGGRVEGSTPSTESITSTKSWNNFLQKLDPCRTILIANLYPLHAGQRGILRQLAKNFPELTIHVFYDESFDQTNAALDTAYQDLGQMADEAIYYDAPSSESTVHELKTPIHETRFVVAEIQKRLASGTKPEEIVIVLLNPEDRAPLERALLIADIPSLIITTLDRALAYQNKQIFLLGLSLEHLANETNEETALPTLAAQDRPEFIRSSSYLMHVAFVRLQQLLAYSQHPFLTRSEMDRAAKPLMRVCGEQFVHKLSNLNNLPIPASTHMSYKTYKSYKTYSFSVSALQEYLECPYSFYAKYVLKAAPPQTPTLEPDGKIRGSFVHDILRRLFQAYGSQLFLPEAISPICNKLPALVERAAEKDEELKNFPAAVVQEFTHRVTRTITALIEREATDYANKKKQTLAKFSEWDFGRSLQRPFEITTPDGLIQITGRIDRIDINEDKKQFTVIDFKTGELPTKEEILGGRALQLPLYLMAVQKTLLPTHTPSAALYYGLKKDRVFGFALKDSCDEKTQRKTNHISQEEWQEVQNQVLVHCVHAVHQVHQGNFDPKPHDIKKCEHCDFKRICGYKATCPEREKRVEG